MNTYPWLFLETQNERSSAHLHFKSLGSAGRLSANILKSKISNFVTTGNHFELSELAYSLGVIDERGNKDILMTLVDTASHADPVGRALTVLRPVLQMSDLPQLQSWMNRYEAIIP